jgi:hypothetical protein
MLTMNEVLSKRHTELTEKQVQVATGLYNQDGYIWCDCRDGVITMFDLIDKKSFDILQDASIVPSENKLF